MNRSLVKNVSTSGNATPEVLGEFVSPASFWQVDNLVTDSAWLEHAPFAFWLIDALKPRTFVELGTHGGFSYFAFCQAVQRLGLSAKCYAIDTWEGDEHSGHYSTQIFDAVKNYNDRHYSAFSDLVRSTFDEALPHFSDGTIDLLHIDGRHFYDDVEHDFETWRPKLSDRAIVLFHDTNVRERDFGVFKLWEKVRDLYPSFEFVHGHGLGVLGIGGELTKPLSQLFASSEIDVSSVSVRASYARLGAAISAEAKNVLLQQEIKQSSQNIEAKTQEIKQCSQNIEAKTQEIQEKSQALEHLKSTEDENNRLHQNLRDREEELNVLKSRLAEISEAANRLQTDVATQERNVRAEQATNQALRNSTSWKITRPLRLLARTFGRKK